VERQLYTWSICRAVAPTSIETVSSTINAMTSVTSSSSSHYPFLRNSAFFAKKVSLLAMLMPRVKLGIVRVALGNKFKTSTMYRRSVVILPTYIRTAWQAAGSAYV
jgi:hypothetical protein